MDLPYKCQKSLSQRISESHQMMSRYPDRTPIIVERRSKSIQLIDKRKFMAPHTLLMNQMNFVIRRRLNMPPEHALFVFVGETLIPMNKMVKQVYDEHADEDGFLYLTYDFENTFG